MRDFPLWPPGPASKADQELRAKYISGMCGLGHHEGKRPKSYLGTPFKVCVDRHHCACQCHKVITKVYGEDREVFQNPEWQPAPSIDLSWLDEARSRAVRESFDAARIIGRAAPEDGTEDQLARDLASEVTLIPRGSAGWLEQRVKIIADAKFAGVSDIEMLTPKLIALAIDRDNPPSQGAVGAVLDRWQQYGFALVLKNPVRLVTYTKEGMDSGLEYMREQWKRKHGK